MVNVVQVTTTHTVAIRYS